MSFQQGLSGLNAASKALDVTSNNVANSSTVGFKTASAHFADVFANSLAGSGSSQVGIGTSVSAVQQQFTQGNVTTTNNPLDIAINGGGFFRMSDNGSVTYSRNGQFHLDSNGFIIDDRARKLTGFPIDSTGVVVQSSPVELQLSAANQAPLATGQSVGGSFSGVLANLNFDSRSTVPTVPWASTVAAPVPTPSMYNYSTATSVYDSLGNAHTLTLYARKTATLGEWQIYTSLDGTRANNISENTVAGGPVLVQFDENGVLDTAALNGVLDLSIDLDQVMTDLGRTNNAASPLDFTLDFAGSTQFGSAFGVNSLQQDGYTSGRLTGISVSADGIIRGNYSNGQTRDMGQVVLANFTNPNGLASLGGNQWAETSTSGSALVGAPNSGNLGVLQSAAIEESNTDLTAELVNMITQQRNYQSNAQSIKTQDQIMQTLVNLR